MLGGRSTGTDRVLRRLGEVPEKRWPVANRPIDESPETVAKSRTPRNVVSDVVTFPVRLVRSVFGALTE